MDRRKESSNIFRLSTMAIYAFLLAALYTYFLPLVSVHLPAFGTKSWSVRDIVRTIPKGALFKSGESHEFTVRYDFIDLVTEIAPRNPNTNAPVKVAPVFIIGALVPFALALAYLLSILNLFLAPLKKGNALTFNSVLAAFFSAYALLGVYFLSSGAQRAFADSLAKVEETPFSIITKNLVQKVAIQPDTGLVTLLVFTVVVFGLSLYRASRTQK